MQTFLCLPRVHYFLWAAWNDNLTHIPGETKQTRQPLKKGTERTERTERKKSNKKRKTKSYCKNAIIYYRSAVFFNKFENVNFGHMLFWWFLIKDHSLENNPQKFLNCHCFFYILGLIILPPIAKVREPRYFKHIYIVTVCVY